eukprot:CAMPEP_0172316166 /NCGR_PEP_ID=MMETSP1058-20130122/27491_1 /TAXON_ID=83371 /ORGANISM="Detonula confervacea, Strain CCMP 353" /LENGTH=420 /DNA_ID=CAMNT_0013030423 /DNA_START=30 /DNA_END=1292 /DNA_ORIENTATION=+
MMSPRQPSACVQSAGLSTAESDSDATPNQCATRSHRPGAEKNPPSHSPKKGLFFRAPKLMTNKSQNGTGGSLNESITNSAPTILIHTPSTPSNDDPSIAPLRRPLRSAMSSRTLHDSLHRGRTQKGGTRPQMTRCVSFARVNIREYERVLGDNPSVTSGPPLSIGWRYAPEPLSMKVDEYEAGKGDRRSSSEYLVPKAVRENMLKEHADVSRREMVAVVRTIQKEKAQRRKTVVNLSMQNTEEKMEKVKRKLKRILKPSKSYESLEATLWDEAHAVAMEKAKRLEESIHRGESVTYMDLYSAGTPCNNMLPSRRNSKPQNLENGQIKEQAESTAVGQHDVLLESISKNQYIPKKLTENQQHVRRSSAEELDIDQHASVYKEGRIPASQRRTSQIRASNIVASESDDEDIFAKLLLADSTH